MSKEREYPVMHMNADGNPIAGMDATDTETIKTALIHAALGHGYQRVTFMATFYESVRPVEDMTPTLVLSGSLTEANLKEKLASLRELEEAEEASLVALEEENKRLRTERDAANAAADRLQERLGTKEDFERKAQAQRDRALHRLDKCNAEKEQVVSLVEQFRAKLNAYLDPKLEENEDV